MLVSNRVQYIRKAMEALKPLLEAIPSELIVVDTKGEETDGSIAIVREYTDKIYPFTWCDDFSKARNVCMDHAKGEWFLYVDDDEWFDDVTEFIEFFQSGECDQYESGYYYTRDYDVDGTYSMGIAGRMIRRRENTCFIGRVHETFNEVFAPHKQFSCFTHHYGYAFQTIEEEKKHQARNVSILKEELVNVGCTPRLCAQMVQELLSIDDTIDGAYAFAMDALPRLAQMKQLSDSCSQWVMVATVRYFVKKDEYENAKQQLQMLETTYSLSEVAQMVLSGIMANMAVKFKNAEDMLTYALRYMTLWDWKQEHPKEAMIQVQLDFPKFCTDSYYYGMVHIGAAAANYFEQYEKANDFWKRLPWGTESFEDEKYIRDYETTKEGLKKQQQQKKSAMFSNFDTVVRNSTKISYQNKASKKEQSKFPKLIKSKVKLTIGMLVSNHVQYIRKAMEALKPLLDAVPSELVVIDTKGAETDGSIDIVREYTDKIYPFTWCDDFSAARNFCLDHAKGEWFLYVDDDEWFDDVQEFIDFFNSKECDNYYSGFYYTRDYFSDGTYSMGIAGRMIRRTENTRFVGRVHETFNEVFAPNKEFSCFTHHYGYAYENEEAKVKKQQRNINILKREIEEKGLTPKRAAQMTQELFSNKNTMAEGYQFCMDSISILEKQQLLMDSCTQWLLTASVRYFTEESYEKLLQQAEVIQKNYPLTPMAQLVIAATVALSAMKEKEYENVLKYVTIYLEQYDWRKANEEEALLQVQLDFPRFYAEGYYYHIVHLGAVAANEQQKYEVANQYWKRLPWGTEGFDATVYEQDLNNTIRGMQLAKDKQYEEKIAKLIPLLEILAEASAQVKQNFSLGNVELAKSFLVGMQEVAITLGTSLDNLIGENSTTVKLLEQYCELLWNCNTAQTLQDGMALSEILCEAVGLIHENFLRDTRRKKTILLFPMKAQDWPLFEPYYQEAKQNGDKVYVIPVPYFEKQYDGTFGEEHYEGENFPEGIDITKYNEYNYKGKLADLIVVKDNYEDKQVFYSVHPFYYIENMEQYAKEVVAVAEWDGGVAELQRSMESLKNLIAQVKKL